MNVLSIQSHVTYGHAGNSAAVFPLQRLGIEVWPVMTVHFSNHTGYGDWRGPLLSAEDIGEVIRGVEDRGALARCDAVLSGYQGAEEVGAVILDAVDRVRQANPDAMYCCDPVLGDVDQGFFVRPGIAEFMRNKAVPAADLVTPNQFELGYLADAEIRTGQDVLAAADRVREAGPGTVLVTSVTADGTPPDALDMVLVADDGAWRVRTPRLPLTPAGGGDLTTALFLGNLLNGHAAPDALARTTSAVFAVMEATVAAGEQELRIVQTQDALADPPARFQATRLR